MRTGRIGPLGSTCSESLAGLWPDFDARSLLVTSTLTKMPPTSSATSAPRSSCMISNDHPGSPCGQLPHRCCADTRRATGHHCASSVDVHYDTHASSTRRHPFEQRRGIVLQRRASQLQMVEVWQQSTDRGGWATHHSTQTSPASWSQCVSSLTAWAASTSVTSSSRYANASGAVRISDPLPAVRPVISCSAADSVRAVG